MKKLRIVLVMLILALIVSGCSNSGVSPQIESKGNTVTAQYAIDYDTFTTAMRAKGYSLEELQPSQNEIKFFSVTAKSIKVNGDLIFIYEFTDNATAKSESQRITSDGQIGNSIIDWIDKPHFYLQGKIIVGYIGSNKTILGDLAKIIGDPITAT